MIVRDHLTGLTIADPELPVLPAEFASLSQEERGERVAAALERMIISASGWRAIFAADGLEESTTAEVDPALLVLAGVAGMAFVEHIREARTPVRVLVGTDTRPTGPRIAHAAIRAMIASGAEPGYAFVCASPEIMAASASESACAGFFYVSASHNPVGHNGVKMGDSSGGVFGGEEASRLAERFRALAASRGAVACITELLAGATSPSELACLAAVPSVKQRTLAAYTAFCHRVIRGPGDAASEAYERFREAIRSAGPGIVGDLNGSARAASIDERFLQDAGCTVRLINARPGEIAHQIVPEGEGLRECREELERLATSGANFEMGYVPDNDGDRGNLVFFDPASRRARQLEAQEVFALSCVAELSWLAHTGELAWNPDGSLTRPVAVVVNGPTSLRIETIAAGYGVDVFRSEVGEANVVSLARELRSKGYLVRILGEGSNGGTITHPSAVRDPLHTIHSVLKLLYAPGSDGRPAPAAIWSERSRSSLPERPSLAQVIATLPRFTTTSAFEPRAIMKIRSRSHAELKKRFEALLPEAAASLMPSLPRELGLSTYEVVNYEGTRTVAGPGNRSGAERGGLKVVFRDAAGNARAFVWMRGSGTEPVFRVMADVEGDRPETEQLLLSWLRELVEQADALSEAGTTGA